jgi:ABC-type phosphate/phosphonate transport system substrate-binding protein
MKTRKLVKTMVIVAVTFFMMSCSSSGSDIITDNSARIQQIKTTAISGNWRITNFNDSGSNKTSNFTGYSFIFNDNGTLTATNGSNTISGSWSVTNSSNSSSSNSSDDIDFNIAFSSPQNFAELTEDWSIVSTSNSKIDLKHVSGGNGGTDLLTFERN